MRRWIGLLLAFCTPILLVACGGVSGGSSNASQPQVPAITVTIAPTSANVPVGQTVQFTATVSGAVSSAVTWQVNSVAGGNTTIGTTSTAGLYTAPAQIPNPASVTVTVVSTADSTKSASAVVTITRPPALISVAPGVVTVPVFRTAQFSATINGVPSTAVSWQVNGVTGGASKTGTISSTGLFTAPSAVPVSFTSQHSSKTTTVTVQAISQADPSASPGSAVITVIAPNQGASGIPVPLGGSGGNAGDSTTTGNRTTCCGGTLGALISRGGVQYVLSNNHILGRSDLAAIGDSIIQPGLIDANCSAGAATTVAKLSQFVNFENPPAGKPLVDAAIAQVVPGVVDPAGTILQLGANTNGNVPADGPPHAGPGIPPSLGMAVAKSGRSTGLTCSRIESISVTVSVEYQKGCGSGSTFTKNFTNQVQVTGGEFSAQGDSGSLIVAQDTADPVALLYAGSDTDTVGNPVADILNAFADPTTGERPVFVGTEGPHAVAACSLPGPAAASASTSTSTTAASAQATSSESELRRATAVRDRYAPKLLSYPEVDAVGVGSSLDEPGQPAILFFVNESRSPAEVPTEVDGIRTRIVERDVFPYRGALSVAESAELARDTEFQASRRIADLSPQKISRARQVQGQHLDEIMQMDGVQGVGLTSSADNPGEAAMMIFVVRGVPHPQVPFTIDGIRTRVRESSRFQAGFSDARAGAGCQVPSSKRKLASLTQSPRTSGKVN